MDFIMQIIISEFRQFLVQFYSILIIFMCTTFIVSRTILLRATYFANHWSEYNRLSDFRLLIEFCIVCVRMHNVLTSVQANE
jgi:hypothetical protein